MSKISIKFFWVERVLEIFQPGKQPVKVKARSLLCYWAVRELGVTMAHLAPKLNISQPEVSMSAQRGERMVKENRSLKNVCSLAHPKSGIFTDIA